MKADQTQQLISAQFELKKVFFFLKTFIKLADKPFLFFQLGVDTIKTFFLSLKTKLHCYKHFQSNLTFSSKAGAQHHSSFSN